MIFEENTGQKCAAQLHSPTLQRLCDANKPLPNTLMLCIVQHWTFKNSPGTNTLSPLCSEPQRKFCLPVMQKCRLGSFDCCLVESLSRSLQSAFKQQAHHSQPGFSLKTGLVTLSHLWFYLRLHFPVTDWLLGLPLLTEDWLFPVSVLVPNQVNCPHSAALSTGCAPWQKNYKTQQNCNIQR